MATFLRPVLWRDAGAPFFERGKMSFVEHFGKVFDHDDAVERSERAKQVKAAEKPPEGSRQP